MLNRLTDCITQSTQMGTKHVNKKQSLQKIPFCLLCTAGNTKESQANQKLAVAGKHNSCGKRSGLGFCGGDNWNQSTGKEEEGSWEERGGGVAKEAKILVLKLGVKVRPPG